MQHIETILKKSFIDISEKQVFLNLVVSNSIICYKLAHDDEVYWSNFWKKISESHIKNLQDIKLFFIDFLPQTSQFQSSYKRKIEHLKEFDEFLWELFHKQKYYYKNPDIFKEHLSKYVTWLPNPFLIDFVYDIFIVSSNIRF